MPPYPSRREGRASAGREPHPSQGEGRASPGRPMEIPEPLRAAAGLAATVLDRARHLPSAITGLPVKVAGIAMQASLRLQQQYAGLVVKGDELLTQLGSSDDGDPPWATFDDDVVEVAEAVTEEIGVDVTAADDSAGAAGIAPALPPLPGTTRARPVRKASATARMGHAPSAFDLAEDVPAPAGRSAASSIAADISVIGDSALSGAPVPGYDSFTLAQLRARLRTYDAATLTSLLSYERQQRARVPFVTLLESRLNRSRQQG